MRQGGNWDNDPVMNCKEITAMLEDYGLVPGELRRGDVQRAFAMVAGCPKKGAASGPNQLSRAALPLCQSQPKPASPP